jgi:hypothetical protein
MIGGCDMPATVSPSGIVSGEETGRRRARALIGWLNEQEAVPMLLGRAPLPTDELSSLKQIAVACREAVASRPSFEPATPTRPTNDRRLLDLTERQELRAHFHGLDWRPAIVDLTQVLSFQKLINAEGLDERVGNVNGFDLDRLLEICLPSSQPLPPLGAFADADGKGFTISSLNPNLRIAGGHLSEASVSATPDVPPVKAQAVTMLITMGTSYVQVARYRDRYFLRDGYHRAAALLRRGVTEVPCIFIEARSFEQLGCVPGSLSYEVLFGDRPPHLVDFWDNTTAHDIVQVATRKVIRVRGEEFVVPR